MFKKKPEAPKGPVYERLPPKERKVHSQGAMEIYTRQEGYGPVVLVVASGPGSSSDVMSVDLEPYQKDVRWLFYDPRGTGKSGSPAAGATDAWNLDAQVADIEAIRSTLQIARINVMANGFGAAPAVAYASKYPDKVERLLLLNPLVSASQIKRADEIRTSRITNDDKKALLDLDKSGLKKSAPERYREQKVALALRIGTCKHDGPQPRGRSDEHKETTRAMAKALGEFDVLPLAGAVTAKTGIVMGRCGFLSQVGIEELKQKIKDSQLVVFENSGQYPHVEEKDLFRKLVRTFFGSPPEESAAEGKPGETAPVDDAAAKAAAAAAAKEAGDVDK